MYNFHTCFISHSVNLKFHDFLFNSQPGNALIVGFCVHFSRDVFFIAHNAYSVTLELPKNTSGINFA
jgi:hypothetical protein